MLFVPIDVNIDVDNVSICTGFSLAFFDRRVGMAGPPLVAGPPRGHGGGAPRGPPRKCTEQSKKCQISKMLLKVFKMPFKDTKRVAKRYKKRS